MGGKEEKAGNENVGRGKTAGAGRSRGRLFSDKNRKEGDRIPDRRNYRRENSGELGHQKRSELGRDSKGLITQRKDPRKTKGGNEIGKLLLIRIQTPQRERIRGA